jgi:hypothetical protein
MNTPAPPIKTGIKPITAPETRTAPKATSHLARLESALSGQFFMFVFRCGTRFRSGRIVGVLSDQFIKVRYFSVKTRELMSFEHVVKLYAEPSVESLTGWFLFQSMEALDAAYPFFSEHFKRQVELQEKEAPQ